MSTTPLPSTFQSRAVERGTTEGIEWAVCAAPMLGAMNGYALLPEEHPWRSLDLQCEDYAKGPSVHGGITYGPTEGWIGFDTLHAGDVWEGSDMMRYGSDEWDRTWTQALVADEARHLARQIAMAS